MTLAQNVTLNATAPPHHASESFTAEQALILVCTLIISFACGCATHRDAFVAVAKRPSAPAVCVRVQFLARPALAYWICRELGVSDAPAVGMLLCAWRERDNVHSEDNVPASPTALWPHPASPQSWSPAQTVLTGSWCRSMIPTHVAHATRPCATQLMQLLFDGDIELGIVCTVLSSVVAVGGIPLSVDLFIRHLEDASFEL
eukprot:5143733-Prymnesium_polylepis.1